MNDPDTELSALFARADDAYRPTDEELARLDARTLPLVTGGLPSPPRRAWRRAAGYGGAGLGVALLAFSVWRFAGAAHRSEETAAPPSAPIVAAAPVARGAEAPSTDEGLRAVSVDSLPTVAALRSPPPPVATASSPKESAAPSSLEEEVRLIRSATDRRHAGDPSGALDLLEEHARRFPAGVLADQRDVERIVALCDESAVAPAEERARAFFATRPNSPLAVRVRASCAGRVEKERR